MLRKYIGAWSTWGMPAIAGGLLPWTSKLTSMNLISDYFQPELNIGASLLAPLACLVVFGAMLDKGRRKNQSLAILCLVLFFVGIAICLGLKLSSDPLAELSPNMQVVTWWLWSCLYLLLFALLGATMTSASIALKGSGIQQQSAY
jgi:MFS family permease